MPTTRISPRQAERANRPLPDGAKPPSARLLGFIDRASGLTAAEWPAFFRSHLHSPEWADLAAQLWADHDPAGFWEFLRSEGDPQLLDRFALELLREWTRADPDAAMAAAARITDKATGDLLRREVVDTALSDDLAKGLELAARTGDFNRFGWGRRPWIERDPEAAVRGLATLPEISKYRHYMTYLMPSRHGRRRIHKRH